MVNYVWNRWLVADEENWVQKDKGIDGVAGYSFWLYRYNLT
jgi:hypothetical protein